MLDTEFGPRYDATQPLVLTRVRQDVSAGNCVAAMISPPRQRASCSPTVISASAATANLRHRVRVPWILEHPCDSWFCDVAKIQTRSAASHGLGPGGLLYFRFTILKANVLSGNVDSRDLHRVARKCAGTGVCCSVSG